KPRIGRCGSRVSGCWKNRAASPDASSRAERFLLALFPELPCSCVLTIVRSKTLAEERGAASSRTAARCEYSIGAETRTVRAGDTLYKRPGIEHGCVCRRAGALLDTFTPQRQDFIAS